MHNIDQNTHKNANDFMLQTNPLFNQTLMHEHFPLKKQTIFRLCAHYNLSMPIFFFPNLLFPNACFHQSHIPLLPFPGQLACYFFYSTDLKWVSLQQHHNENQCDPNRSKPLQCYVFTVVQKQRNCRVPVSFLFIVRHCYIERVKTSFHITYPEPSNL